MVRFMFFLNDKQRYRHNLPLLEIMVGKQKIENTYM